MSAIGFSRHHRARRSRLVLAAGLLLAMAPFGSGSIARADGTPASPALDQDLNRLVAAFDSRDAELVDEALVQLRWAGITDPRLFDHLLGLVLSGDALPTSFRSKVFEALSLAGHPEVHRRYASLAADNQTPREVKAALVKALANAPQAQEVARVIQSGTDRASSYGELWAVRHRNGLAVADRARLRWAARDLYLHKYGRESLDVAAEELRRQVVSPLEDRYVEDAMAFLCKALGLAGMQEYVEVLQYVANNAVNAKLRRYAERSAQYYDTSFRAEPLEKWSATRR